MFWDRAFNWLAMVPFTLTAEIKSLPDNMLEPRKKSVLIAIDPKVVSVAKVLGLQPFWMVLP